MEQEQAEPYPNITAAVERFLALRLGEQKGHFGCSMRSHDFTGEAASILGLMLALVTIAAIIIAPLWSPKPPRAAEQITNMVSGP